MKNLIAVAVVGALIAPSLAFASVSINLVGGGVTVQQGHSYSEPGYSANSTVDGDVTGSVVVTGGDTSRVGNFSVGYSVTDSALDSASASRSLTVVGVGGGSMPYCSGPMAPGWVQGLEGGGCGGTGVVLASGHSLMRGGVLYTCPEFFGSISCLIK